MDTATFLQTHRVFNLNEAVEALNLQDGKKSAVERLKYYVEKGRLKIVAREVYASIPPDTTPARFQPDRYLVAAAARPEGIFSHHAALELLGAAHSDWNVCTVLSRRRRPPIQLEGVTVRFLRSSQGTHPRQEGKPGNSHGGTVGARPSRHGARANIDRRFSPTCPRRRCGGISRIGCGIRSSRSRSA